MFRLYYGKRSCAFATDGSEQIKIGIGDFKIANNLVTNATLWQQIGEEAMSETFLRRKILVS